MTPSARLQQIAGELELSQVFLYDAEVERGNPSSIDPGEVTSHGTLTPSIDDDDDDDERSPAVLLSLTTTFANSDDEQIAVIRQRHLAVYEEPRGLNITEDELREYAECSTIYQVHPFAREFLQSITQRLGIPPYTLPVMSRSDVTIREEDGQP